MTGSGTVANAFSLCKSVVESDDSILIAALLDNNESIGWFVRPGTPIPNEDATGIKVTQTTIVTSIIKQNENYLGKVGYVLVHQELADVILFPKSGKIVLCVVIIRPYELESIVSKVSSALDSI